MTPDLLAAMERILDAFVAEARPGGGVERGRSMWQSAECGAAAGSGMFEGDIDPRYLRFAIEALYRVCDVTGRDGYAAVADAHAQYMCRVPPSSPSWALGNALESIGLYCARRGANDLMREAVARFIAAVRQRQVDVTTLDGVTYRHVPCGYGVGDAADAGWTNDLSLLGAGLVWAYEVTGDQTILDDAISFAEYFVQPWRPEALGPDGYWRCGTWRDDLGSWVIGPAHFSGFESTNAYADETSWVFSTESCTDFLTRLHRHHHDPRYVECCAKAAEWVFESCQFDDGGIGMCGRDDKWYGLTACALTQVAMLRPMLADGPRRLAGLEAGAQRAYDFLSRVLPKARLEGHGVDWVNRTTRLDPDVNQGMMWAFVPIGLLNWPAEQ